MKKRRKFLLFTMVIVMMASIFVGCGKDKDTDTDQTVQTEDKKDNDTKINDVDIIIERLVFLRKNYSSNIECDKIKQE